MLVRSWGVGDVYKGPRLCGPRCPASRIRWIVRLADLVVDGNVREVITNAEWKVTSTTEDNTETWITIMIR